VPAPGGGWINEGTIYPAYPRGKRYGQAHQIPYRCLLPKGAECDNLLVPVCLSASHVAFSSVRVEPTWMVLGQSAGVAAALCAKARTAVQELPIADLQRQLRRQEQVLDLRDDHLATGTEKSRRTLWQCLHQYPTWPPLTLNGSRTSMTMNAIV